MFGRYTKYGTKLSNTDPKCIIGPSGPTGKPLPTAQQQDMNLTTNVLKRKMYRTNVPFKKPITSGIPDPAAAGCAIYV